MRKKSIILLVIFLALLVVTFLFLLQKKDSKEAVLGLDKEHKQFVFFGFDEEKEMVERYFSLKENFKKNNQMMQLGITSHHLPDAFPIISEFWKNIYTSSGPRKTFIVLGPDHFENCNSLFATSGLDFETPFGVLEVDEEIRKSLIEKGVEANETCFQGEHSIGVQILFIKYLYPQAKIVPIIFSSRASEDVVKNIADFISPYKDEATVILSVDFSHFNALEEARKIDGQTLEMIRNGVENDYKLKMVDSPGALETTIMLAKKWGMKEFVDFKLGNSFEFSGNKDSTVGYISGYFK